MRGVTPPPAWVTSSAMTIEDNGSCRTETTVAPTSTPTAGVSLKPGRCEASRPPAIPKKIAGNVGPPRALPSETPQASPLQRTSNAMVPTEIVPAWLTIGFMAS
jgi:hypothetical protein